MIKRQACLICSESLSAKEVDYHHRCCRKLFGHNQAPRLPYTCEQLQTLTRPSFGDVQTRIPMRLEVIPRKGTHLTVTDSGGTYFLKLPWTDCPFRPETEHLTMLLARLFQIETAPQGLIALESGELAYLTKRIDYTDDGLKLQMKDMCQLSDRATEDKYGGALEEIGEIIKRYSSNPMLDAIRFFELCLFSFLIGNSDLHRQNFSLVYYPSGEVQLSAAYGLIATDLLAAEDDQPQEMALCMNGKKTMFTQRDFCNFARDLGLIEKQLENSLVRFARILPRIWELIESTPLPDEKISKMKTIIEARGRRLGCL